MHGNHDAILKEIGVMKNQMQTLGRDMQALRKLGMLAKLLAVSALLDNILID